MGFISVSICPCWPIDNCIPDVYPWEPTLPEIKASSCQYCLCSHYSWRRWERIWGDASWFLAVQFKWNFPCSLSQEKLHLSQENSLWLASKSCLLKISHSKTWFRWPCLSSFWPLPLYWEKSYHHLLYQWSDLGEEWKGYCQSGYPAACWRSWSRPRGWCYQFKLSTILLLNFSIWLRKVWSNKCWNSWSDC